MKNTYKHLSSEDRDKIAILRAQGISYNDISIAIGRDKSTISRKINRNRTPIYNVYLPHKAHERANRRKQISVIPIIAGKKGLLKMLSDLLGDSCLRRLILLQLAINRSNI